VLARSLERDWQRHVMNKAAMEGWHGFHIRVSKGTLDSVHYDGAGVYPRRSDHDDAVGIPDLFLVHPERGQLLLPELKRTSGRVSVAQERWIGWLDRITAVRSGVWRPGDERAVDALLLGQ
jgi:hypothetical protein